MIAAIAVTLILMTLAVLYGSMASMDYKFRDRQAKRQHELDMADRGYQWGLVVPESSSCCAECGWVRADSPRPPVIFKPVTSSGTFTGKENLNS